MVNTGEAPAAAKIRCRPIADRDLDNLVDLFRRGFGARRTLSFWRRVLACLSLRPLPDDVPRYGYLLEHDGAVVGAILLIFARTPGTGALRANVSSWYVEPAFRGYASLLVAQALKLKSATYLNISAARHTWPILEAQGYRRYSDGVFVAVPLLRQRREIGTRLVAADRPPDAPHEPFERELLHAHARHGCISAWCVTGERAFPFVFRRRIVKGAIPCAQLIYCADIAHVVRFARPIGSFLAPRAGPLLVIDANAPIADLPGRFLPDVMPKYFRGPVAPRLGDLADTEAALFGM
jgi:hypothetical protein